MSEHIDDHKNKRKRKKSFLKNARKYAKKGRFGRGSELDVDTYQYFVRVLEVYREGFDDEETKIGFANNVLEQTEDQELNVCCNQVGCRVVEQLLPFANDQVLDRLMQKLSEDLRKLCSDPFASHVLQALLTVACKKTMNVEGVNQDILENYKKFTLKLSKFLLNNLEDYVWDTYGNHIIRTAIINLAQLPEEKKEMVKTEIPEKPNCVISEDYANIVKEYAERLINWPQFKDLPYSEITSGLLQILLKALKNVSPKVLKKVLKKLNEESFSIFSDRDEQTAKLPDVFYSKAALMLLEVSLQVAPLKIYTQIYAKCFVSKLSLLANDKNTNFSVQKLLTSCTEKSEFEAIYDEIVDHMKDILSSGYTGVILALAQGCKKLSSKQGNFIQSLMKCLNCYEPEERQDSFVLCVSKLITYEELETMNPKISEKDKLNLHGTLMVQAMLDFHKPIKIINGILNLEKEALKNLFCNSMGSHIVDSYMKSLYVGEKSRIKLIMKLKGLYRDLATSKFGSRVFDAIWEVSNHKSRFNIMEELTHKEAAWSNSEYGKIIANKVHLSLYKRNKEEWINSFDKVEKKKKLFADIIS